MKATGTVPWMLDPLWNIYRLFKGQEEKLVSCLLGPSARLKVGKGVRERIRKDSWNISLATHEIQFLKRVVGHVLVFRVEFSGKSFMRTPKSMGTWFYAVERLREPVPCTDLMGLRLRVWWPWRNLQNWSLLPLEVGQRVFLHWAPIPLLEPVLYGSAPNTRRGPHGRSQYGHVQSSAAQILTLAASLDKMQTLIQQVWEWSSPVMSLMLVTLPDF